jgi:hypothetical protein
MIMVDDMFESIDHLATNAIPKIVRAEVMKVKTFVC